MLPLSLGQAEAAEVQPLPHCQQHRGEQSPQILLHMAVISVQKLPPSIINHMWLPAHSAALGQLPAQGWVLSFPTACGAGLRGCTQPGLASLGLSHNCGTPGSISASLARG